VHLIVNDVSGVSAVVDWLWHAHTVFVGSMYAWSPGQAEHVAFNCNTNGRTIMAELSLLEMCLLARHGQAVQAVPQPAVAMWHVPH